MAESGQSPDLAALARDWVTLWQSELAAIAADREAQESWQAILALWAGAAGALLAAAPRAHHAAAPTATQATAQAATPTAPGAAPHDPETGRTGAAEPPGAAAVAAAPDPRDAEIDRLARHVAELESRLADLEHGTRRSGSSHRRGTAGPGPRHQRR